MAISNEIMQKLENLQIVSNKTRFMVLTSLYSSSVLKYGKHSQTFTEIMNVLEISNSDLAYHLNLLLKGNLITKKTYPEKGEKSTYYKIAPEGKRIMKLIGLSEKKIMELGNLISRGK